MSKANEAKASKSEGDPTLPQSFYNLSIGMGTFKKVHANIERNVHKLPLVGTSLDEGIAPEARSHLTQLLPVLSSKYKDLELMQPRL